LLCTSPSTATAIALQLRPDAKPASHVEPPACLLHHWRPGVGLVTHLSPIGAFPGPYPFA
jgi:3',5'-cyclic-AMP phosphodiesterase